MGWVRISPQLGRSDVSKRYRVSLDKFKGRLVFGVDATRFHGLAKYDSVNIMLNEADPALIAVQRCTEGVGDFAMSLRKGATQICCAALFERLPVVDGEYEFGCDLEKDGLLMIDTANGMVR